MPVLLEILDKISKNELVTFQIGDVSFCVVYSICFDNLENLENNQIANYAALRESNIPEDKTRSNVIQHMLYMQSKMKWFNLLIIKIGYLSFSHRKHKYSIYQLTPLDNSFLIRYFIQSFEKYLYYQRVLFKF